MDVDTRILLAQRAIRNKYNELRRGFADERVRTEKQLAPIVKPLKTLVDLTTSSTLPGKRNFLGIKQELKTLKSENEGALTQFYENQGSPSTSTNSSLSFKSPSHESQEEAEEESEKQDTPLQESEESDEDIVFEDDISHKTPHEMLEDSYRQNPRLSAIIDQYIQQNFGALGKKYFSGLIKDTTGQYDNVYGVFLDDNRWKLGSQILKPLNDDSLQIGAKNFRGSEGLYELIFKSKPENSKITDDDLRVYSDILNYTNAHRRQHESSGRVKSNTGYKYTHFIKPIYNRNRGKQGSGFVTLSNQAPQYKYWNNPNELVERLALLIASRNSGNNSHDSEIASIEEELREVGCIE